MRYLLAQRAVAVARARDEAARATVRPRRSASPLLIAAARPAFTTAVMLSAARAGATAA